MWSTEPLLVSGSFVLDSALDSGGKT
jgi:hypothetical protein